MDYIRYGGSVTDEKEKKALLAAISKALKTGQWQTGPEAKAMEEEAAKFLGMKYGIVTSSGSCAGLLALEALELPKGSEVIISACTFPTIFNIILQCGLMPVVVDAKIGSYTFDVKEVEKAITPKTGAIIAIHPVGNPVDMPALMKMVAKQKRKIYVLEDNCDGWGGSIGGKKLGSFGDISITSFHAAHIVSMGVGGGVFTNDQKLAENVRVYRDWGRLPGAKNPHEAMSGRGGQKLHNFPGIPKDFDPRFIYTKIGYNFQILELQAAMGRVQLTKSKKIKALRKKNFDYLVKHLSKHKELIMPQSVNGADVCWFSLPLSVQARVSRGDLVAHLEKNKIETRSMFAGDITRHPAYKNAKYRIGSKLTEADFIIRQSFWIPVHPRMTQKDRERIINAFGTFFKINK